jgi:hypothetical protein
MRLIAARPWETAGDFVIVEANGGLPIPQDLATLTVLGSQAVGRPDGRVAIRLHTKEIGSIACEVDQHAIDALRGDLLVAEKMLRQLTGRA